MALKTKVISVRLPEWQFTFLAKAASAAGVSLSEWLKSGIYLEPGPDGEPTAALRTPDPAKMTRG